MNIDRDIDFFTFLKMISVWVCMGVCVIISILLSFGNIFY